MREVKKGEMYYADLSPVVGSEQGGIRPVIIRPPRKLKLFINIDDSTKFKDRIFTHICKAKNQFPRKSIVYLLDLFLNNVFPLLRSRGLMSLKCPISRM